MNDCVYLFTIECVILTNEIIAANNKILTKRSSNCSRINCHIVLPSSAGSSVNINQKQKEMFIPLDD